MDNWNKWSGMARVPWDVSYQNARANRQKGAGYFGPLKRPDGYVSTELSAGIEVGRNKTPLDIPLLVPTLTREEIDLLLSGKKATQEILDKAINHAYMRMQKGLSPFAQQGEQRPLPPKKKQDGQI
jgi:hypothetical protein